MPSSDCGYVMLRGMIAEMETGEGKTLGAALAGIPVHVITVNDFLVSRDAEWMGPLYRALGISVGTVVEGATPEARRQAYGRDITFCTNKQIVFDYLRDRLLLEQEDRPLPIKVAALYRPQPRSGELMMRGLCFAIVDEADSGEIGSRQLFHRPAAEIVVWIRFLARLRSAIEEATLSTHHSQQGRPARRSRRHRARRLQRRREREGHHTATTCSSASAVRR